MCCYGSYNVIKETFYLYVCIFVVLILKRQVALIEFDFDSYKSLRLSTTREKQREIF